MSTHIYRKLLCALLALAFFAGDADAQIVNMQGSTAAFSQPELEQMLAPIALYPDALLAQVLMASTYPLEVVEAARWSQAHPDLQGNDAIRATAAQSWDASVKSLVAFPQVLATLNDKLEWTERLGDAFLSQQAQVMDTVQDLRRRANFAGTLSEDEKLDVEQDGGDIEIGSGDSGYIYVPYCDPFVAYGAWPWAQYPPVFWAPWPDYYGYNRCNWGPGIYVQPAFLFGNFVWRTHRLRDRRFPRPPNGHSIAWQHDPIHRHGLAYHDAGMNPERVHTYWSSETVGIPLPPNLPRGVSMVGARTAPNRLSAGAYMRGGLQSERHTFNTSGRSSGGHSGGSASASGGSHASSSASSSGSGHSHR